MYRFCPLILLFFTALAGCSADDNDHLSASDTTSDIAMDGGRTDSDGDSAQPSCPASAELLGDHCLFPCPNGWERNAELRCLPGCPVGAQRIDGRCAPPCPAGYEAVDTLCRTLTPLGPAACEVQGYDPTGSEASDLVLYVHAQDGGAAGPGTSEEPFATLAQAWEAIPDDAQEVSIVVGPGTYETVPVLDITFPTLRILGACAQETILEGNGINVGDMINPAQVVTFEMARVTLRGEDLEITTAQDAYIHDCIFERDGEDGPKILWAPLEGGGDLRVEGNRFVNILLPLWLLYGAESLVASRNIFEGCSGSLVSAEDTPSFEVTQNQFLGTNEEAVQFDGGDLTVDVRIVGNWFDEAVETGIDIVSGKGSVVVQDNSFHRVLEEAIRLSEVRGGVVSRNRVLGRPDEGDANVGLSVVDSSDVIVDGFWSWDSGGVGLGVLGSDGVSLGDVRVFNGASVGVSVLDCDAGEGVTLNQATLALTHVGLESRNSRMAAIGVEVGGSHWQGMKFRSCLQVSVSDSTVAGSGSTGLEMTLMGGDDTTIHEIHDNLLVENRGVGLLVRGGGAGLFSVRGNHTIGTRPGFVTNAQNQSGTVGDGIALLSGTDGTGTRAQLLDNSLDGNIRLGIIAHGDNTQVEIGGSTFGDGNGYGGYIGDPSVSKPNLILQEGAKVDGTDAGLASPLDQSVIVANEVSLLGGGDPR